LINKTNGSTAQPRRIKFIYVYSV